MQEASTSLGAGANLTTESVPRRQYIVDSSALIDGRLPDICAAGFVDGVLIVPDFVRRELRGVAADPLKNERGQRGLLALKRLEAGNDVHACDIDFAHLVSVDDRIIAFAKRRGATVITSDQRLGRVAHTHGVAVMNLYWLAYAMQPPVFPGQRIHLRIID